MRAPFAESTEAADRAKKCEPRMTQESTRRKTNRYRSPEILRGEMNAD